jgi:hypothetical protein
LGGAGASVVSGGLGFTIPWALTKGSFMQRILYAIARNVNGNEAAPEVA